MKGTGSRLSVNMIGYGEARRLARLSLVAGDRDQALDRLRIYLTLFESDECQEAEDVRAEIIRTQRVDEI